MQIPTLAQRQVHQLCNISFLISPSRSVNAATFCRDRFDSIIPKEARALDSISHHTQSQSCSFGISWAPPLAPRLKGNPV